MSEKTALVQTIMTVLRQLYRENPGAFESEMAGDDAYSDRRVQQALEALLREQMR